jgi:hypothetical protein
MKTDHNPVIMHRTDGRWEVNCPECLELRASGVAIPVGIGLAVRSWESALLIWENHIRPFVQSLDDQAERSTHSHRPLVQHQ